MDLVFSTDQYAQAKRYAAWRDAICDVYVHVDVSATNPERYRGFIRETKFGEVVMTDILLSEQRIRRSRQHISQLDTTQGLGRIATEFCSSLASEATKLDDGLRAGLGNQLMDMIALTLQAHAGDIPQTESWAKTARLRLVQQWIEQHIADADLSLDQVAAANGISLRYLHTLFAASDMSASEWIWDRRLQLAYDGLARGGGRTITSIALDHGFNSPTHFTTRFRRKYGIAPRDVVRTMA